MRWMRRRTQRDFEEEIRSHLELEARQLEREGLPPEEARFAAHRAFGNVTSATERFYESQRVPWLDHLLRDVRLALRGLGRSPGFTLPALCTLACGIGVNTAAFTLLYALSLRALPVPEPERVVSVYQETRGPGLRLVEGSPYFVSYPEYREYRDGNRAFEGLAAFAEVDLALGGGAAVPVAGMLATCDYFTVLRIRPALGRGFTSDECSRPGASPVAVVSHGFWRRRLGADPAIVGKGGKHIILGGTVFTVVGVAAPGFAGTTPSPADVWIPVTMQRAVNPERDLLTPREWSWLAVVGRLRPGVTLTAARADLMAVAWRSGAGDPRRETDVIVNRGALLNGPEERREGAVIAGGVFLLVGLVLALACTNVMNLLLARGAARRREIGIRLSIGASRGRLVLQLMTESILLALLGGAAGLAVAYWLAPLLLAALGEPGLTLDLTLDRHVFGWALAVSLSSAIAFGLAPARHAGRQDLASVLKGGEAGPRRAARLRDFVVGAQVAGCLVLLVVAGLLGRGLAHAGSVDPGFAVRGVLTVSPGLREAGYTAPRAAELLGELLPRAAAMPGVESVALAATLPLVSRLMAPVAPRGVDEAEASAAAAAVTAGFNTVSASYFVTLGIPILRGCAFADGEPRPGGAVPAVVSAAMARRLWRAQDALGRRFDCGSTTYEVVGVARDARTVSLAEADGPFFYAPADTADPLDLRLVVRTREGPEDAARVVAAELRRLVGALDRGVVVRVEPLGESVAVALRPARVTAFLCAALGALAMLVAVVGIYGVVSYGVSQRRREIGVRIALGAVPRAVVAVVARDGARAVAMGAAVGLLLAAGAARLVRGMLYGVSSLDPVAFLGILGLLALAAGLGLYWPARRASRIDPMVALRTE